MGTRDPSVVVEEPLGEFEILNEDTNGMVDREPTAPTECGASDCSQFFNCCNATCNCAIWG